jgi:hypothetical protein
MYINNVKLQGVIKKVFNKQTENSVFYSITLGVEKEFRSGKSFTYNFKITYFGEYDSNIQEGTEIFVEGELKVESYEDKNKNKVYQTVVQANLLQVIFENEHENSTNGLLPPLAQSQKSFKNEQPIYEEDDGIF